MRFLIPPHKVIFLHFLIEENPLKIAIQGNNLHIFLRRLKNQIKKKGFFEV